MTESRTLYTDEDGDTLVVITDTEYNATAMFKAVKKPREENDPIIEVMVELDRDAIKHLQKLLHTHLYDTQQTETFSTRIEEEY